MVWYDSLSFNKLVAVLLMCCTCFFVARHHHAYKYQYMHIDQNCSTIPVYESKNEIICNIVQDNINHIYCCIKNRKGRKEAKNVENGFWIAALLLYDSNCKSDDSCTKDIEYTGKVNKHGKFNEAIFSINVVERDLAIDIFICCNRIIQIKILKIYSTSTLQIIIQHLNMKYNGAMYKNLLLVKYNNRDYN